MKQVKMWVYILILYSCIVFINLIVIAIGVADGSRTLPFGPVTELLSVMVSALADLVLAVIIGFIVEAILKMFMKKTLVSIIIITIVIYECLLILVRSIF